MEGFMDDKTRGETEKALYLENLETLVRARNEQLRAAVTSNDRLTSALKQAKAILDAALSG
jgi:hypothetical protein